MNSSFNKNKHFLNKTQMKTNGEMLILELLKSKMSIKNYRMLAKHGSNLINLQNYKKKILFLDQS